MTAHSFVLVTFTFILVMFGSQPAVAGQDVDEEEDFPVRFVQEVVVTPTRHEEPLYRVPASVSVITSADIKKSTARDIPELLRSQAGLHVIDISGNHRSYRVDIRGFGETASSNLLVLVDGRRLNLPDLSGTDWLQIPLSRVDRIEVARGGRGSVLYGDNATGGTINIITNDGTFHKNSVSLHGGSYSTFDLNASLNGSVENLSYAFTGNYGNSDGYRDNGNMEGGNAGITLKIEPNKLFTTTVSAGFHTDRTGLPGKLTTQELNDGLSREKTLTPNEFAEVDDLYFMVQPQLAVSKTSHLQLDLSYRQRKSLFFSSFAGGTFDGDTTIDTFAVSPKMVLSEQVGRRPHTLILGADIIRSTNNIINTTIFDGFTSLGNFALRKKNAGIYLHEELFLHPRFGVSGGYRYDRVSYDFVPSVPSSTRFQEHLTTVGLSYSLNDNSQFFTGFSRSFRYPLLDELFNFFSNTIETDLQPQHSSDYEVGVRGYFRDIGSGTLNYFYVTTTDEIFFNPSGGPFGFGANENLDGPSRRQGIEITAAAQLSSMSINGNYAYTHATILEGSFGGRNIPNVPHHRGGIEIVSQATDYLTVGLEGSYVGRRLFESDYQNIFGNQGGYVVANLKIRVSRDKFVGFIDIRNLFDREYEQYGVLGGFPIERAFFPSPGINFRVGSSVEF